jgi:hypothetical protein
MLHKVVKQMKYITGCTLHIGKHRVRIYLTGLQTGVANSQMLRGGSRHSQEAPHLYQKTRIQQVSSQEIVSVAHNDTDFDAT